MGLCQRCHQPDGKELLKAGVLTGLTLYAIGALAFIPAKSAGVFYAFLPAYLGTNDSAVLGEYTRKIMAYYAVKVPFMFSLINHDKFPEEGCKSLIKLIWVMWTKTVGDSDKSGW